MLGRIVGPIGLVTGRFALLLIGVAALWSALTPPASASTSASKLIGSLPLSTETPAGYNRDSFNHWTSVAGRGCDSREVVLLRQNMKRPRRCGDERGRWYSVYDGKTVRKASGLDVDHMVPLAEAWDSGARRWSA